MIEIKSWFTGDVIFSGEYGSVKAAVEAAVSQRAHLDGANLYRANLYGANFGGANLDRANLTFSSHDLLSEILKRAAGDDAEKLKIAGYILICRDKCWKDFVFLATRDPLGDWALDELAKWVQDGDDAPDCLRERAAKRRLVDSRT